MELLEIEKKSIKRELVFIEHIFTEVEIDSLKNELVEQMTQLESKKELLLDFKEILSSDQDPTNIHILVKNLVEDLNIKSFSGIKALEKQSKSTLALINNGCEERQDNAYVLSKDPMTESLYSSNGVFIKDRDREMAEMF